MPSEKKDKAAKGIKTLLSGLLLLIGVLVACGLYYLVVAALTFLACFGFGLEFTWGAALGSCAVIAMGAMAFALGKEAM